jgi:lipoprotein NlpI
MKTRFSASTSVADAAPRGAFLRRAARLWAIAATVGAWAVVQAQDPINEARAALDRARVDFRAGRVPESVVGFDRVATLAPNSVPELWERGIALYYVNRFRDCRAQFEVHRTVNPADVENAAWHYLCVARAENPAAARAALLPVRTDPREPMREVYLMFAGRLSPESVLVAGIASPRARFYASLYVGLFHEAQGEPDRAVFYIRAAASDEFAGAVGGYMHDVARVHMQVRKWPMEPPRPEPQPAQGGGAAR